MSERFPLTLMRYLDRLRGLWHSGVLYSRPICPQSPGGGLAKNGNEPDRPHKTGRPARGFLGPGKLAVASSISLLAAFVVGGGAALSSSDCQAQSVAPAAAPSAAHPAAAGLPAANTAAAALPAANPAAPKAEYKLSIAVGPAYAWGKGAADWAQLIKDRSGGRIVIKQFPGASATGGDPLQEFVGLRQGTIDLAVGSAMYWAGYVKSLNVFALPFLVGDSKGLDALFQGEVGAAIFRAIEDAGVVPLAWGDNEFHELSTSKRVVKKPGDVAGLRVRATGSAVVEESMRALGATPVRLRWTDAQNALIGGTVDAQETVPQAFIATKAHTLNQKHLTLWSVAAEPLIFAVSRAAWDAWSAADRDIVRQAAIDAAKRQIELSRAMTKSSLASLGNEYKDAGVEIVRPSPEERAAFAAATKAVFEKWAGEIGAELVKQAEASISAARKP